MTILNVVNDIIVIDKLALKEIQGEVQHSGELTVEGNVQVNSNLVVKGTITADTFNVKNLVTDNGSLNSVGNWMYNVEEELNGKGLNWTWGGGNAQLAYRLGGRIWSNSNIDLDTGKSYSIQDIPVLSLTTLGGTVVSSNLQRVGKLASLTVIGDTTLSDFVYINSSYNRVGIGTDEPGASFSILDNNVEIGIGSDRVNQGFIGTLSNHDFDIVTDSTARISIKANGEIIVGDEINKGAVVRIHGSLYVDNIVTDTRLDRSSSLEFKTTDTQDIYGLGITWSGTGSTRQFMMRSGPDRFWSSESVDLADGQSYFINGFPVVSLTHLGESVTQSSLTTLGTLNSLSVEGNATFYGNVSAQTITFDDTNLSVNASGISGGEQVTISIKDESSSIGITKQEITVGDKNNIRRPVKVFGPLSVNVRNPDPTVNFTVGGDVSIGDKRFTKGRTAPVEGTFVIGDICWNTEPASGHPIGWVCIGEGTPGTWAGFGIIA